MDAAVNGPYFLAFEKKAKNTQTNSNPPRNRIDWELPANQRPCAWNQPHISRNHPNWPIYLAISLPFYLSIYLSLYQSTFLSTHLPISLSIYLSTYLSTFLSTYLSSYLSTFLSIYLAISLLFYLSIYPSLYQSTFLSTHLPISLSIYLSTYLSTFLSTYLSTYLSINLPFYLPIWSYLPMYLSPFQSTYLPISLSIYLSIYPFAYLSLNLPLLFQLSILSEVSLPNFLLLKYLLIHQNGEDLLPSGSRHCRQARMWLEAQPRSPKDKSSCRTWRGRWPQENHALQRLFHRNSIGIWTDTGVCRHGVPPNHPF